MLGVLTKIHFYVFPDYKSRTDIFNVMFAR